MNTIKIGRDPFARQTIRKESTKGVCHWCGGHNRRGGVYRYYADLDSGHVYYLAGQFCSIGCLNSYHS